MSSFLACDGRHVLFSWGVKKKDDMISPPSMPSIRQQRKLLKNIVPFLQAISALPWYRCGTSLVQRRAAVTWRKWWLHTSSGDSNFGIASFMIDCVLFGKLYEMNPCRVPYTIVSRKEHLLQWRDARFSKFVCLFLARMPPVGHGLLIIEVSRSQTRTHHSR